MARKKRSSEEVDSDVADKTGTAPTKRVKEKSSTSIEVASSKNEEVVQDFEFVTFGRPYFDIRAELAEDEDFDSDDEDFGQEIQRQAEEESEKYTDKLLKDFPEHKWAVSKKGKALLEGYALQSMKRDQDSFNMYIYNDWSAYGEQEIAENMLSDFTTAFNKKEQCPYTLWAYMEAVQLYMNFIGTQIWYMTDDSERLESAVLLLSHALLATLAVLERENLLSINSRIPNVSLIVAAFFRWVVPMEIIDFEEPVFGMILKLMEKHTMEIDGFYKMDFMAEVEEEVDLPDSLERKVNNNSTSKDKFNYRKHYKEYVEEYGTPKIGGSQYDITKMSKAERKKHNFDKKDPLDEIPLENLNLAPEVL